MSDLLVYTAIFGGRDVVKVPKQEGFDFRYVTEDETYVDDTAAIITSPPIANDPRRSARFFKTMPQVFFPDYKRWIWIDGNILLKDGITRKDLEDIRGPLSTFRHRDRNCAYEEAEICSHFNLDAEAVIRPQVQGYQAQGFPRNWGLGETMVIVRDNTPEVRAFNRAWWSEVSTKSVRDQISFNYVAWKRKLCVHYIGRCTKTQWFWMLPHSTQVDKLR